MRPALAGLAERRAATAASRGLWWLLMGIVALLLTLDQGIKWMVATSSSKDR